MTDRTDWALFVACVLACCVMGEWLYRSFSEEPVAQPMCSDMTEMARESMIERSYDHLTDGEKKLFLPHVELRSVHPRAADREIGHVSCWAALYVRELVRDDSGEAVDVEPEHEWVRGVAFNIYTTDDGNLVSYTDH